MHSGFHQGICAQDSASCMANARPTCSCTSADKDGRAVMRLFETSRIFSAVSVSKPCSFKASVEHTTAASMKAGFS